LLFQITDPRGHRTSLFYVAGGRLATVVDPLGAVTTFSYDPAARQTVARDPLLRATTFVYDAFGGLVCQTDSAEPPRSATTPTATSPA
jgi:YD repeat-containing protein